MVVCKTVKSAPLTLSINNHGPKLEKAKLPLVNTKSFLRKENIVPMKQKRCYYDQYE